MERVLIRLRQELLDKLSCTEAALTQTKLDLDNECKAKRRLQQEVKANKEWKEQQGRRPFVVAVIDADADSYVVSKYQPWF
jgi:C4-type Zn-finger protein